MTQAAYNLADFALRTVVQHKVPLRVEQGKKKSRRLDATTRRTVSIVLVSALLLALVLSVIYSQTQLTELDAQIAVQQQALADAQSEYTYYNNELSMHTSMEAVEAYAAARGMIKMDKSQITYINTGIDSRIVRSDNAMGRLFANMASLAVSAQEYINN